MYPPVIFPTHINYYIIRHGIRPKHLWNSTTEWANINMCTVFLVGHVFFINGNMFFPYKLVVGTVGFLTQQVNKFDPGIWNFSSLLKPPLHPPNFSIDTKNDGLENASPFNHGDFGHLCHSSR